MDGADAEFLLRKFGPSEVRLTDQALMRRAERTCALLMARDTASDAAEERLTDLQERLRVVLGDLGRRVRSAGTREIPRRAVEQLWADALALQAQINAAERVRRRAEESLDRACAHWTAVSQEMARRFLAPPVEAVTLRGELRRFRLHYDENGQAVVSIALA